MPGRTAALLAQMAATSALIDSLISKAKGERKPEPEAPKSLGSGTRAYTVSNMMPSCARCSRRGRCGESPRECGQASWFPVFHRVSVILDNGAVVSTTCRSGRKGDGEACEGKCRHAARALAVLAGGSDRGVELALVLGKSEAVPKCPNCREKWGVAARGGGEWECRNPVCARDGRPWRFREGDTGRPPPMRHSLVIMDREPGRLVVKR